jgi:hypothetical protein
MARTFKCITSHLAANLVLRNRFISACGRRIVAPVAEDLVRIAPVNKDGVIVNEKLRSVRTRERVRLHA